MNRVDLVITLLELAARLLEAFCQVLTLWPSGA